MRWFSGFCHRIFHVHRPDEDEDDEDKKSFMQKLNAIQEVLTKVQNVLDAIASFGERIYK